MYSHGHYRHLLRPCTGQARRGMDQPGAGLESLSHLAAFRVQAVEMYMWIIIVQYYLFLYNTPSIYAFAHHSSFEIFWLADTEILHGTRCLIIRLLCPVWVKAFWRADLQFRETHQMQFQEILNWNIPRSVNTRFESKFWSWLSWPCKWFSTVRTEKARYSTTSISGHILCSSHHYTSFDVA
jgi:hypothetical protein